MTDESHGTPPAVQRQKPPEAFIRIANPIFTALLRSPAHGLLDRAFALIHLTGRKTGRRYSIVVARHTIDGVLTVMTSSPWRVNARGGADAEVTSDGRTWRARAELVEDPEVVADAYAAEIDRLGVKGAQRQLGISITVDRPPTREELLEAVRRDQLSLIRFQPA